MSDLRPPAIGSGSASPGLAEMPAHLKLTNPIRMAPPVASGHPNHTDEEEDIVVHSRSARPSPREPATHSSSSSSSAPSMHRSSSAGSDFGPGISSHSRLSPAKLFDSRARLVVSCALVGLACSNLAIGLSGLSAHNCFDLAAFLCVQSFFFLVAIPIYHMLAAEMEKSAGRRTQQQGIEGAAQQQDSGAPRSFLAKVLDRMSLTTVLQLSLYTLLWVSTLYSAEAITWLAEDGCAVNRTLRQLSLFDVMLVLSIHVLVVLYYALRRFLPKPYIRRLQRSVWQSMALLICVAAFIANVTQLQSHDADGLDTYHWGFSNRPEPCPRDCTAPPASPSNVRHTICLDMNGEEVSHEHCSHEPAPTTMNTMLQACPLLQCVPVGPLSHGHTDVRFQSDPTEPDFDDAKNVGGETPADIGSSTPAAPAETSQETPPAGDPSSSAPEPAAAPSSTGAVAPPPSIPTTANVRPYLLSLFDPECPRKCVEYPPASEYTYPGEFDEYDIPMGCWSEQEFLKQRADGVANPQGWVGFEKCTFVPQKSTVICPARPCAAFCDRLATSSTLYAVLYSLIIVVLLYALFYTSISQTAAYQSVMRAAGIDTWSSYQPQTQSESGAARPSDLEAPSGASMQPSRAVATASSTAPTVPSVCHALVLAVRALWMGRNGCHLMKPWWRHILFLASICLLSLLVAYSMSNMLFLVEAHCRDFLISSVLNAVLTFAAAIIILAVAFQRQDQLRQQQSNPFEAMGLLVSQDDAEGEDELDEFGLEEEPIDAGPEARTRRALEMEQSTQL